MTTSSNQPRPDDAVLGGQSLMPESSSAVLGGLAAVKQRFQQDPAAEVRIAALMDALKYGEDGLQLILEGLQAKVESVQDAAYQLLRERKDPQVQAALKEYWQATQKSFDAKYLKSKGCSQCMSWESPTHHDWMLFCGYCHRNFSYDGCSCDGCCGDGPYRGFGGGKTYYHLEPENLEPENLEPET